MRAAGPKEFRIWEWVVLFGVMATAVAVSEVIGLGQKWEDAVVYTVVVFAVVIMALRPAWGRTAFWRNLMYLFALHDLALVIGLQAVHFGRFGIPKLLLIPAGGIEGLLIAGVLWKSTLKSKPEWEPR